MNFIKVGKYHIINPDTILTAYVSHPSKSEHLLKIKIMGGETLLLSFSGEDSAILVLDKLLIDLNKCTKQDINKIRQETKDNLDALN